MTYPYRQALLAFREFGTDKKKARLDLLNGTFWYYEEICSEKELADKDYELEKSTEEEYNRLLKEYPGGYAEYQAVVDKLSEESKLRLKELFDWYDFEQILLEGQQSTVDLDLCDFSV